MPKMQQTEAALLILYSFESVSGLQGVSQNCIQLSHLPLRSSCSGSMKQLCEFIAWILHDNAIMSLLAIIPETFSAPSDVLKLLCKNNSQNPITNPQLKLKILSKSICPALWTGLDLTAYLELLILLLPIPTC